MSGARIGVTAALVLLAQLVDVAVLDRWQVAGTTLDLVLLVVVASALVGGSVHGAVVGVCAGLLADLTPPGAGLLGVSAVAYGLAGAAAGRWQRRSGRGAETTVPLAVAAAGAGAVLTTAVHLLFGWGRYGAQQAALLGGAAVLVAVAVGVVVLPLLLALDRRVVDELP